MNCDLQANNLFCTWIDKMPTSGDVAKLISSKEDMTNHYRDIVEHKGETA